MSRIAAIALGLGLFAVGPAGCVRAAYVAESHRRILVETGPLLDGLQRIDAECQRLSTTRENLAECRAGRDAIRAAVSRIHAEIAGKAAQGGAR